MAFATPNDLMTGRIPAVSPRGAEAIAVRFAQNLATGDLAANKCGGLGFIPAGCVPVSVVIDADKLDSSTGLTVTVGFVKDDETDLDGAGWAAASNVGQAGGVATLAFTKDAMRIAPAGKDRKVGFKVSAAAATAVAGVLGLTVTFRPA